MIGTEQERDALMAAVEQFGRARVNQGWANARGAKDQALAMFDESQQHLAAIRAMLAPDDAVVIGENVINDDGEPEGYDRYKLADALYNG